MKKFMLISLVTAVCFIIAGISALNVNQDQVKQILTSSETSSMSKPAEKTFSIKDVNVLSIGIPTADIEFIPSSDLSDTMVMTYQEHYTKDKKEELYFPIIEEKYDDGRLSIEFKHRDKNKKDNNNFKLEKSNKFPYFKFVFNIQDSKVKFKVPTDFNLKTLSLGVASGQIEIPQIKVEKLNINLVSGDLNLKNIMANTISIDVVTGDIVMNSSSFKSLNIEAVTGDIDLKDVSLTADYKIETVTGDVSIDALDALTGNLKISSTTGDIEIDGVNHKRRVEITSQENPFKMNLEVVTGDILIKTKTKL
jgi:DUF4097 and DUF4098 domain-containing protein YvlB